MDLQPQRAVEPSPAPIHAAVNAGAELDLVAVLPRVDGQVAVQLVTAVDDSKFDLLAVAGGYPNGTVVRIDPHVRPAADGVGLGPLLSPRAAARKRRCGQRQSPHPCQLGHAATREGEKIHFVLYLGCW